MAEKKTAKKKEEFVATAKVMGKLFTGKGDTIYKAIENINTGAVAGTVILTVSKGKSTKERVIPMVTARRIFMTVGLTREVALKQISTTFDGV